jgi:hypothetical protein
VKCPTDYHCYFLTPGRGWTAALAACSNADANLTAITSASELAFVAMNVPTGAKWIGGNDMAAQGQFVWSDGEPWSFAAWIPGQPSDPKGTKDCVTLRPAKAGFAEDACDSVFPGICERAP